MKMSSSTKLCGWNRGLNCSTSTSIGSWAQSFATTIILNDHHVLSCLFQLDLKLISSLQITAIWTMSYLIRGKSSVPGARPRPFPIRWLFDARKTHLQPIAKCSRSYNSKENAHPKFSVIDVHSNADGIIVYSKANGLGVHSKVTVRIRPKPSAPHAVIFDLDTSHPAKASITMYVHCRPPHRTSGQSYNRHVNPYPASTLRYPAGSPRLFAQGLGHP